MSTPEEIRRKEHAHVEMSYDRIDELVFAGNNMCCQTHFEQKLLSKGISADISLEGERLDNPQGVSYFFWFPWTEDEAPQMELIEVALDCVEALKRQNIKLYVHCKNGHGRTSTFLAAYFIRMDKTGVEQALKMVFEKRPSGHITGAQKQFLIAYEGRINAR
jgi:protein tyrosine phosphatase